MQNNKNNITLCLIILMLSFVNIIFNTTNISALSYQSEVGIGFTFNPTLSVSLSSNNLVISNLTPGSSSDSNSINVVVATNASYGYTLSVNTSSDNLTHSNNIDTFNSIATDADLASLATDNTWGYSTSLDSGTTWGNYNGLSSSTSTTLIDNSNTADSTGSIDFKIGARAGSTQASGIYTNTINFIAVSKVAPMSLLDSFIASGAEQLNGYFKMQDMTHDICNNVDIEESELQLIDVRDNKIYWVAKLKDGNCWMTQNLDLDLSHEVELTSETSDIDPDSYGKTIYTAETGYSKDETTGVVSWLPNTIDSNSVQRANTIDMVWNNDNTSATVPGWNNSYYNPYSADAGDRYHYTDASGDETVYTSLNSCLSGTNNNKADCQHAHIGNYYNWSATVASNTTDALTSIYTTAANSICSKNWRLPAIRNKTTSDFHSLATAYNITDENSLNLRSAPLRFTRTGYIYDEKNNAYGSNGGYWSSTVMSSGRAYDLYFGNGHLYPTNGFFFTKSFGFTIRCLAR